MDKQLSHYEARTREFTSQDEAEAFSRQIETPGYTEDGGTVGRSIIYELIAGGRWLVMYILLFWVS